MTSAFSDFALPPKLAINAWTGESSPQSPLGGRGAGWGLTDRNGYQGPALAPPVAEPWDWRHPEVGWGLVLPDDRSIDAKRRPFADDAAEPIRELLASRPGSPVLRWHVDAGPGHVWRYDAQGGRRRLSLVSPTGNAALPRFLLIAASPDAIPWSFQYAANLSRSVGRLDLDAKGLEHYVDALLNDWAGSNCDVGAPLVWSANLGQPDISWLMDAVVARKLAGDYAADADLPRHTALLGADATGARLIESLVASRPALVVTTSHGMTGPLDDQDATAARLGLPVDVSRRPVDLKTLADAWSPDGAIWYAHACCGAGSDAVSAYAGLFDAASEVGRVLDGVAAACGARTAPLPRRLLGAERPLRAFVGMVEPTFDWTLRDPATGQPLAHKVRAALYDRLYAGGGGRPVGWAFGEVFGDAGALAGLWTQARNAFNQATPGSAEAALYYQVASSDRLHTVILGDPTVGLPVPARPT